MKIEGLDRALTNIKGEDLIDQDGDELTLKGAIVSALLSMPDQNLSGKEKYERYRLAKMLMHREDVVELTTEEAAQIKEVTGQVYMPIVVGRIWDAIEGDGSWLAPA